MHFVILQCEVSLIVFFSQSVHLFIFVSWNKNSLNDSIAVNLLFFGVTFYPILAASMFGS